MVVVAVQGASRTGRFRACVNCGSLPRAGHRLQVAYHHMKYILQPRTGFYCATEQHGWIMQPRAGECQQSAQAVLAVVVFLTQTRSFHYTILPFGTVGRNVSQRNE